jgi:tRNA(Ile)-lysidine synthase
MLAPESHVVVGVSGGADSVCLLFVLRELQKSLSFTLEAVHVNHGLRAGAASDADFVGETCAELGVALRVFSADVAKMARERGVSCEEAGRDYRYECLRAVAGEYKTGVIAVAHHLNDRAETLLFHLFRGSGLRGLSSIRPVRDEIVRPLLCCTRQEIEAYLAERGLPYRTDPSNASEANTRSYIRQQIMPRAEAVNAAAVENMAKTAELAWEADCYLRTQAQAAFGECAAAAAGQIEIDIKIWQGYAPLLQKYVLLLAFEELLPVGRRDISFQHVGGVLELAGGGGSKELHLPSGLRARKEYGKLLLHYPRAKQSQQNSGEYKLNYNSTIPPAPPGFTVAGLGEIAYRTFPLQKNMKIPQNTYTKWFDCDKITSCAVLRRRKRGDYLTVNSAGQRKKLSDYLIDEKVPRARRDELYVLADGPHVLWVCGLRISEHYKVTDKTTTVIEIKILPE